MHQPTLRVLHTLELMTQNSSGMRLADFSRELNIPKSTLLPILQTLCDNHYFVQDEIGRYLPGTGLFVLGAAYRDSFPVLPFIRSQLTSLVDALGETCYFGVLDNDSVLYIEKVDSPQPLRMLTSIGTRLPAYATGIGKALLSGVSEEQLRQLFPGGLRPLTAHTVTDYALLAQQLQQAQIDGYTWEIEESTEHIRCFAAPIRKFGKIVAAISIALPLFRYQNGNRDTIVAALLAHAQHIGEIFEKTDAHFGETF